MLPTPVLEQVQAELPDWQSSGMSVMEVSHRGKAFSALAAHAEATLRDLLSIGDNYRLIFMQGGAAGQFATVPLNLSAAGEPVDYVQTGSWSKKAVAEASRFSDTQVIAEGLNSIPAEETWQRRPQAAYLHYTPNETIGGVEFHFVPDGSGVPLVADMSSTILSRPIEVDKFGVIYAGAQKNIGPAGVTLVIVHEDLTGRARVGTPTLLDYKVMAGSGSMQNTPPTFAWYVASLVFDWIKASGGLAAMGEINQRKAGKLYEQIDGSAFYHNPVAADCRSWMNIPFTLADPALDAKFLSDSETAGLCNLKGHRSVGGMRASIYNAMPEAGVDALIDFMRSFEAQNG